MVLSRFKLVTVFLGTVSLFITSAVVKCGAGEPGMQASVLAQPDEPKQKDPPKEDAPQGFLGIRFESAEEGDPASVVEVIEDSPAAKAGFKEGDKLLKIGDKDAKDAQKAIELVRALKPGQQIVVKVKRDDKEMDLKVTIGKRPTDN